MPMLIRESFSRTNQDHIFSLVVTATLCWGSRSPATHFEKESKEHAELDQADAQAPREEPR